MKTATCPKNDAIASTPHNDMQAETRAHTNGIRVIFHITPSTYVAGLLSAQQRGLKLDEFLDAAITAACADDSEGPANQAPWSPHAMSLFLQLADTLPEAFRGAWRVLYAKVLNDPSLWVAPKMTVDDHEAGLPTPDWHINEAALAKAWPRLVSGVFMC